MYSRRSPRHYHRTVTMKSQCIALDDVRNLDPLLSLLSCPLLFLYLAMVMALYRHVVSPQSKSRAASSFWTKARAKHFRATTSEELGHIFTSSVPCIACNLHFTTILFGSTVCPAFLIKLGTTRIWISRPYHR